MAAQNFKVKHGLTVGNYPIIDSQGNASIPGSLTVLGSTTMLNLSVPGSLTTGGINADSITTDSITIGSTQLVDSSANITTPGSITAVNLFGASLTINSNEIINSSGDLIVPGDVTISGALKTSGGLDYSTEQYVDNQIAIVSASSVSTGKAIAMAIVFG